MFEGFFGNEKAVEVLKRMIEQDRLPHALLFTGPEGVGKATLARRLAAAVLGGDKRIEQDDLSLPHNRAILEEREKWPATRRAEEPLYFASHPDFLTFPPDGPLRQITIQQMRLLKQQAQFRPLQGSRRVFLIDKLDRANEQAANSLLKILEEPPEYLTVVVTAENPYDLQPTIRSRVVALQLNPLPPQQVATFVRERGLDQPERRARLSGGCPGRALSLDLEEYDCRAGAMMQLLKVASAIVPFSEWVQHSEEWSGRGERFEDHLSVLYALIRDVLLLQQGSSEIIHSELRPELEEVARQVSFDWLRRAVAGLDELASLLRRNIQRTLALDALLLELRRQALAARA